MKTATKKRKRKRVQKPNPMANIFVGTPVPFSHYKKTIATNGELKFFPFRYPFLDSEQRRPRVWVAYSILDGEQLVLGYVWKQSGAQYWKARQPGSPWRGRFASQVAAGKALRAPFLK